MKIFSRVILPILLLIYIGIETYAKLHHTSICGTEGCELAGELLKFNSVYLNFFGAAGALLIAIFGWLSLRKSSFEKLFFLTLYAAIAFESIMISYQIIANPEPCIFCLGVYSSLLLIALFSNWRYLVYAIPAIAAIFVSMNMLAMTQNKAIMTTDGTYLIHSETCPHCKKVKAYFKEHNIAYKGISVFDTNARFFIKQLDINSIPVLVIKKGNLSKIIKGDKAIIEYYNLLSKPKEQADEQKVEESIYKAPDSGCSASVTQESEGGCEDNGGVPLN